MGYHKCKLSVMEMPHKNKKLKSSTVSDNPSLSMQGAEETDDSSNFTIQLRNRSKGGGGDGRIKSSASVG